MVTLSALDFYWEECKLEMYLKDVEDAVVSFFVQCFIASTGVWLE